MRGGRGGGGLLGALLERVDGERHPAVLVQLPLDRALDLSAAAGQKQTMLIRKVRVATRVAGHFGVRTRCDL